jgi:hypothetical protein
MKSRGGNNQRREEERISEKRKSKESEERRCRCAKGKGIFADPLQMPQACQRF